MVYCQIGANVMPIVNKTYTILPTEFYNAFAYLQSFIIKTKPLYLFSRIWGRRTEPETISVRTLLKKFQKEIRKTVRCY